MQGVCCCCGSPKPKHGFVMVDRSDVLGRRGTSVTLPEAFERNMCVPVRASRERACCSREPVGREVHCAVLGTRGRIALCKMCCARPKRPTVDREQSASRRQCMSSTPTSASQTSASTPSTSSSGSGSSTSFRRTSDMHRMSSEIPRVSEALDLRVHSGGPVLPAASPSWLTTQPSSCGGTCATRVSAVAVTWRLQSVCVL